MEMTLAKALRVKNRLVAKLNRSRNIAKSVNSYAEDRVPNYQMADVMIEVKELTENLIALKTAITKANLDIAEQLHGIEEAKSTISFLSSINTTQGPLREYGEETPINHLAVMTDVDIAKAIEGFENDIEALQDEINQHNFSSKITVDFTV